MNTRIQLPKLPTHERAAAARRRSNERPVASLEIRTQRLKSTFQPATLPRTYRSKDHPPHTTC